MSIARRGAKPIVASCSFLAVLYATMRAVSHAEATSNMLVFHSRSEAETIGFGRRLGALLRPGDLLLLFAPFGAGKTHLTKGIAAAWGVDESDVNSPSFVLINEYESDRAHRRAPIYHVDLYRVETPDELATVGLDDVIAGHGLAVIEWAEHAQGWFPHEHLAISIEHVSDNERLIRLHPRGKRYVELVRELRTESGEQRTENNGTTEQENRPIV
jgi:tRNA threonylcarbamoyladenosine biosynthesis protein TsaE